MMERKYYLIDYHLKGLPVIDQTDIRNDVFKKFVTEDSAYIFDVENNYENVYKDGLILNEKEMEKYLINMKSKFEGINQKMISKKRYPLFVITNDLVETMKTRNQLIQLLPESECNKILNCKSFEEYMPPIYQEKPSSGSELQRTF